MSLEHELTGLAAMQESAQARVLRRAARRMQLIVLFNTIRAYRALFLDEAGEMRPAALTVIADIGARARLGVVDSPRASEGELREFAGRRAIALHVLARLDLSGVSMRDLARKLREAENE